MFCNKCGTKNIIGDKFCSNCGEAVLQQPAPVQSQHQPPIQETPQMPVQRDAMPFVPPNTQESTHEAAMPYNTEQQAPGYMPQGGVPQQQAPGYTPQGGVSEQQIPGYTPQGGVPEQQVPTYIPQGVTPTQQQQPYAPKPIRPGGGSQKSGIWIPIIAGAASLLFLVLVVGALWRFTEILPWSYYGGGSRGSVSVGSSGERQREDDNNDRQSDDDNNERQRDEGNDSPLPTPSDEPGSAPTPTLAATQDHTNSNGLEIPPAGGEIRVNGEMEFTFSPVNFGRWEFITSNNGGDDPYLTLYDDRGSIIAEDDDSAGNSNARIAATLNAGTIYTIQAGFYTGSLGSYTLTVSEVDPSNLIPYGGGEVRVNNITEYSFLPSQSGIWEFRTYDNGSSDPVLTLYDSYGNEIAHNDDTDGLNSFISIHLDAHYLYYVLAGFYDDPPGSYSLSASYATASNDGAPQGYSLNSWGDYVNVNGTTMYEFIPNESGLWLFASWENGSSDPYLRLLDYYGNQIDYDDDGAGRGYNSLLAVHLDAWETYYLEAGFYSGDSGSYDLSVNRPLEFESEGGSYYVWAATWFAFTPNQSGYWEFFTESESSEDPQIFLYDSDLNYISNDDDSLGNYDAVLYEYLEEGLLYYILVNFHNDEGWSYLYISYM